MRPDSIGVGYPDGNNSPLSINPVHVVRAYWQNNDHLPKRSRYAYFARCNAAGRSVVTFLAHSGCTRNDVQLVALVDQLTGVLIQPSLALSIMGEGLRNDVGQDKRRLILYGRTVAII